MNLSKHFKKSELDCPCCGQANLSPMLLSMMDMLRDALARPVVVTSAYRCPAHNKKIGGAPKSKHLSGLAVDVAILSPKERYDVQREANRIGFRGIGHLKGAIHLDIRDGDPWCDFY